MIRKWPISLEIKYSIINITIPVEVIAEAVYVLDKVYKMNRETIHRLIHIILSDKNSVIPHYRVVAEAIEVYAQTKFDFVDCLMVGYAKHEQYEIITFDKKLKKYMYNA